MSKDKKIGVVMIVIVIILVIKVFYNPSTEEVIENNTPNNIKTIPTKNIKSDNIENSKNIKSDNIENSKKDTLNTEIETTEIQGHINYNVDIRVGGNASLIYKISNVNYNNNQINFDLNITEKKNTNKMLIFVEDENELDLKIEQEFISKKLIRCSVRSFTDIIYIKVYPVTNQQYTDYSNKKLSISKLNSGVTSISLKLLKDLKSQNDAKKQMEELVKNFKNSYVKAYNQSNIKYIKNILEGTELYNSISSEVKKNSKLNQLDLKSLKLTNYSVDNKKGIILIETIESIRKTNENDFKTYKIKYTAKTEDIIYFIKMEEVK